MKRLLTSAVLSAAISGTSLVQTPAASAGERWHRPHGHVAHHHRGGDADLALAGILGLAVGALVVGLAAEDGAHREPIGVVPRPRPYRDYGLAVEEEDGLVYADESAAPEPWTVEWYAYCADRYRTFDDNTGTFKGADGQRHFCVAQ